MIDVRRVLIRRISACRLTGSTSLGSPSGEAGGEAGGGAGGDGAAGNPSATGDFLRRSHPLSEHAALHPAYRLNYMDHLYHQLQASTHSPSASLHGECRGVFPSGDGRSISAGRVYVSTGGNLAGGWEGARTAGFGEEYFGSGSG